MRTIALQDCVGLAIHPQQSLLNPSPPPPLWVVTEHWIELPVSQSRFSQVICFTHGMYMLPCYSLNSPRSLLPPLCPQVSSFCLRLRCCPAERSIRTCSFLLLLIFGYHFLFSFSGVSPFAPKLNVSVPQDVIITLFSLCSAHLPEQTHLHDSPKSPSYSCLFQGNDAWMGPMDGCLSILSASLLLELLF